MNFVRRLKSPLIFQTAQPSQLLYVYAYSVINNKDIDETVVWK
jgi:hypothetical protein